MGIKCAYPGSLHDIKGVEKWLRDMTAKGLRLEEFTSFGALGNFKRCEPNQVRYYLEPDFNQYESEEMKKAYREQGWNFLCELRGVFLVYETEGPMASNPPSIKLSEKQLNKKLRGLWVELILWLLGLPLSLWSLRGILSIDYLFNAWSRNLTILLILAASTLLSLQILMGLGKGNDIRVYKRCVFFQEDIEPQNYISTIRYIQHWASIPLMCLCFVALFIAVICL